MLSQLVNYDNILYRLPLSLYRYYNVYGNLVTSCFKQAKMTFLSCLKNRDRMNKILQDLPV